jgi:hypothetical protein
MLVKNWVGDHTVLIDDGVQTLKIWWEKSLQGRSANQQKTTTAILIYSAWNIWKECNRRTFELGLFSKALGKLELPP